MSVALQHFNDIYSRLKLTGDVGQKIERVVLDSRKCRAGDLFIAVRGVAADGHHFLPQAIANGCTAVLVDQAYGEHLTVPTLVAEDTRPWPALLSRELHEQPDAGLLTIGITGTNGKTTTSWLVRHLLQAHLGKCGLLGTILYDDGLAIEPAPLTTPDGVQLYERLAAMRNNGCRGVAMEISSHALDQQRVAGLSLDIAVLMNLSRDHLDYHADMQAYKQAKLKILDLLRNATLRDMPARVVINVDDPEFAHLETKDLLAIRFSTQNADLSTTAESQADLTVSRLDLGADGTRVRYAYRGAEHDMQSRLVGRYNVENMTAALAVGLAVGIPMNTCLNALSDAAQIPGRMERITLPNNCQAMVDYAHTPDALAAVLRSCRELTEGRLILVFGCGGDRDSGKRALMGRVAAEKADITWLTSDNPRSEDPSSIIKMIETGYLSAGEVAEQLRVESDRAKAIHGALIEASAGDLVIVAGKGHENYQLVGNQRLNFDDAEVIRNWAQSGGGS